MKYRPNVPIKLPDPASVLRVPIIEFDCYTEGPAVDDQGYLYFTDLAGKTIWCYRNGFLNRWATGVRPNGQCLMPNGDHLVCDSDESVILQFDNEGSLLKKWQYELIGRLKVRCPNDICVSNQGEGFYFTDSVRHTGAVFYQSFDGRSTVVADGIDFANGIAIDPDDRYLMVAESYANRILKITLKEPGIRNGRPEVFATLPFHPENKETGNLPDGIRLDLMGRLWVAHYGMQKVHVVSPEGELLRSYDTGIPLTSNLCFAEQGIYVTGGSGEPGPGSVCLLSWA